MDIGTQIRRFPVVGDMVVLLMLFFLSQIVIGWLFGCFGLLPPETSAIEAVDVETYMSEQVALGKYTAVVYPLSILFSIAVLWLYIRLRGGRKAIRIRHSALGFDPNIVLMGVLWLLAAQVVLEPLTSILPKDESQGVGRGLWACFTVVISSAVLEEVLCRGLILETFRKRWGVKTSILFSSLFFGIIHLDWATSIVAVVAGIIFGVLYVRTSSLYTTIIIHAVNNAMAFALICFGVGDTPLHDIIGNEMVYYVVYGVAVVVFVAASAESYFRLFRNK